MRVIYTSKGMSKVWGARYTLGARYLSKNTVINYNDAKTLSSGVIRLGCESNHSHHFEPRLRISGAITPIPSRDFAVCRDATLPSL